MKKKNPMANAEVHRKVLIHARPETVFSFFLEPDRFAAWWGKGSTIDPVPGGRVHIVYPGGEIASGIVEEIQPPSRIVFTYGYERDGALIRPGGSRVSINFQGLPEGTWVTLTHEVESDAIRDMHIGGWRYQLAVFSRLVSDTEHKGAEAVIDSYFRAWQIDDAVERTNILVSVLDTDVEFRDAFGIAYGIDDLSGHIGNARAHVGAAKLVRKGPVRQSQGTAVCDWEIEGSPVPMKGTNVFELGPAGRIRRIVGIASA